MTVEVASVISDLNPSYPAGGDPKSEGDDHLRLLKTTVKATFPNVTGAVTPTHTQLNYVAGVTSAIQTQLNAKADASSVSGFAQLSGALFTGAVSATNFYVNASAGTVGYAAAGGAGVELYASTSGVTPNTIRFRTSNAERVVIKADGSVTMTGALSAASFTGALSGNISQFTNDAGYITSAGSASAAALTGTTLASNVTGSSLNSVGTLTNLTVTLPIIGSVTGSSGSCTGNASTATTASSVPWIGVTSRPTALSSFTNDINAATSVATVTNYTNSDSGTGSYLKDVAFSKSGTVITLTITRTYHAADGGGGP